MTMSNSKLQPITSTPLDPSQREKLLSALEAKDFQTALQIIPKDGSSEIRVGPNNLTPLHYACMHGRVDIATLLIDDYNCDIDTKSNRRGHGFTPMHLAAKHGHAGIIELLFSKCQMETVSSIAAPPSSLDHDGNTPLHTAAIHGQLTAVKCLINKYGIDHANNTGHTPLHLAAMYGRLDVVKYLVSNGCNISPRDAHSRTPLPLAAGSDQISDEHDTNTKSPLHTVSQKGHIDVVKYLTEEQKADPSCQDADGNTPLHLAALCGQLAVVRFLIEEKRCDPMCKGQNGKTPLHAACQEGHINVVKYLIDEQKADPSCRDENGITPLLIAAVRGQLAVVRFLIEEKRCDPMCKGQYGRTPLHAACQEGHIDVVKYLIDEQKADPSCRDANGNTPLHLAAFCGQLAVVRFLIEEKRCDPMCKGPNGKTPLHNACQEGHIDVVKYLIDEQKADPSCRDENAVTPLYIAAVRGQLAVVRFLIEEKRCDLMCKGPNGKTPLHAACQEGHIDVVKYLIDEQNAAPSCRNADGNTPFHIAALRGQLAVVRFLIEEKRCDPMCKGRNGRTPLHNACQEGHIDVVKYLIDEQKADPSCRDVDGVTPLHIAAVRGQLAVVSFLIEKKRCDPMCKGPNGKTPLHAACQEGHIDVVKYLIDEQKADPSCRDVDGNTPLHLASQKGNVMIVKYLVSNKGCDPSITNSFLHTPVDLALLNGSKDAALYLISKGGTMGQTQFPNTSSLQGWNPLYPIVKICVVGDMSSGKSTLIEALQEVLQFETVSVYGRYFRVGISANTAGIVATEVNSNRWGRITVYDFAGGRQFHASHEALLGNMTEAVMLIVVDLRKSEEEIKKTVAYWQLLLANAAFTSGCYYVIFVGSHADTLKYLEYHEKDVLLSRITVASPNYRGLKYVGSVCLNCHGPFIYNRQIQELLERNIKSVRIHMEFDYRNGSYLEAFIPTKLNSDVACDYDLLMAHIHQCNNPELEPLESSPTLFNACEGLSASGHLVFLKNKENRGESLVILNKQPSLICHGAITNMIKEYSTSEGMIKQSSLMSILDKVFDHNQALIKSATSYMLAMPLCCEVTTQLFLDSTSPSPGEKYLFFPDLISNEKPANVWQPSASFTSYFEWSLKCSNPGPTDHFFTPRFVQLLLINLIRHFGLTPSQDYSKDQYHLQGCKLDVWKNGICWRDASGIKTVVEVTEQSTRVNVVMGSLRGSEVMCHEVLLQEILSIKEGVCPEVETEACTTYDLGSPSDEQRNGSDMTLKELQPQYMGTKDSDAAKPSTAINKDDSLPVDDPVEPSTVIHKDDSLPVHVDDPVEPSTVIHKDDSLPVDDPAKISTVVHKDDSLPVDDPVRPSTVMHKDDRRPVDDPQLDLECRCSCKWCKRHSALEDRARFEAQVTTESLQEKQPPSTSAVIDPRHCSLEHGEENAILNVYSKTTSMLFTADCSGLPVPVKDPFLCHIQAELRYKDSIADCMCDVIEHVRAAYKITYRTSMRGQHQLCVKVDGMHIHRSPFSMFAQVDPRYLGAQLSAYDIEEPIALALAPDKDEVRVIERKNRRLSLISWRGEPQCVHLNPGMETVVDPAGIAVDDRGCVYIVQKNQTLLKFSTNRQLLKASATDFKNQSEIDSDLAKVCIKFRADGRLYVCISMAHKILIFDTELRFIGSLGTRGTGPCEFNYPCGVDFDDTFMYVLDTGNNRIQVLDEAGSYCREFTMGNHSPGDPRTPFGLHIDSQSNLLYATDPLHHQVLIYDTTCGNLTSGDCVAAFGRKGSGPGEFCDPRGIVVDSNGFVFVCDHGNNRVTVF